MTRPAIIVLLACALPMFALHAAAQSAPHLAAAEPSAGNQQEPLRLVLTLAEPASDAASAPAPTLQRDELRTQLERELGVIVELAEESAAPGHADLHVQASTLRDVRISIGERQRTVDLSSAGPHATETLALVAASMLRDEASELLGSLRSVDAAVAPSPTPRAPLLAKAPVAQPVQRTRGCAPTGLPHVPFGVNLVPYVGTSSVHGTHVQQALSLNVIGGSADALRGFELGGAFNLEQLSMCGMQITGAANLVLGPMEGMQLGSFNMALGHVHGAQVGVINVSAHATDGVQLGVLNVAGGALHGVQLGILNIAATDASGWMLGLVNVSEHADLPVGVLNIYTQGHTHLDTWVTDAGLALVGIEHGGRRLHNIAGIGFGTDNDQGIFTFAYGLGVHAYQAESCFVDVDALGYGLLAHDEQRDETDFASILQLRVPIGWRLTRGFALFGGPAFSLSIARTKDNSLRSPGYFGGAKLTSSTASNTVRVWPGFTFGARFL